MSTNPMIEDETLQNYQICWHRFRAVGGSQVNELAKAALYYECRRVANLDAFN
jgi:hypothetical protein